MTAASDTEGWISALEGRTIWEDDRTVLMQGDALRVLAAIPDASVVLDPFTGSGSTLIAARRAGRRGVGVELSETHAQTARRRLDDEVAQLNLLDEAA